MKRRQTAHVYRPPTALDLTPQGKARQFAVLLHLRRPCAACGAALYTTVPYRSLQRLLRRDITRLGPLELVRCKVCRDANRVAARDADPAVAHRRRLKAQQQARYRAKQRDIAQAQEGHGMTIRPGDLVQLRKGVTVGTVPAGRQNNRTARCGPCCPMAGCIWSGTSGACATGT